MMKGGLLENTIHSPENELNEKGKDIENHTPGKQ